MFGIEAIYKQAHQEIQSQKDLGIERDDALKALTVETDWRPVMALTIGYMIMNRVEGDYRSAEEELGDYRRAEQELADVLAES